MQFLLPSLLVTPFPVAFGLQCKIKKAKRFMFRAAATLCSRNIALRFGRDIVRSEMKTLNPYTGLSIGTRRGIDTLTEPQRKCLTLVYVVGYTQAEVAEMIGMSQQAVAGNLNSAKKRMREYLSRPRLAA